MNTIATIATIAQPPSPIAPPITVTGSPGADWGLLLAGLAWAGRQIFEMWGKKEDSETQLTRDLINNLLESNRALIASFQAGFNQINTQLQEQNKTIQLDVQRNMTTAAAQYAETRQTLGEIRNDINAIRADVGETKRSTLAAHARLDLLGVSHADSP